jgi:hypothetical protein
MPGGARMGENFHPLGFCSVVGGRGKVRQMLSWKTVV